MYFTCSIHLRSPPLQISHRLFPVQIISDNCTHNTANDMCHIRDIVLYYDTFIYLLSDKDDRNQNKDNGISPARNPVKDASTINANTTPLAPQSATFQKRCNSQYRSQVLLHRSLPTFLSNHISLLTSVQAITDRRHFR